MYISTAEARPEDLSGIWESIALVSALSAGALVLTWRRKDKVSKRGTHWAVLLSAHGGLVIVLHVTQTVAHLGSALVLTAMAERVIWDVSDGLAERIDRFFGEQEGAVEEDDEQLEATRS